MKPTFFTLVRPALAGVLIFSLAGCGSQEAEIETALRDYRTAIQNRDVAALQKVVVAENARTLAGEGNAEMLEMLEAMSPATYTMESLKVTGDRATMTLTATFNGQPLSGTIKFTREDGVWKVAREDWEVTVGKAGDWASELKTDPTHKPAQSLRWSGHEGAVTKVEFSPDGGRLVSVGYDDFYLRAWDRWSGALISEIELPKRPTDMTFLPSGDRVAVFDVYGNVTLYSLGSNGFFDSERLPGTAGKHGRVAVSADGTLLVATSHDGAAMMWDLSRKTEGKPLPKSESMRGVAFSPTGNVLAAGSIKNSFSLWNLEGMILAKHKEVKIPKVAENSDVCSVAFSPDGSLILTGHMDSSITLWNAKKRKQLLNFYVPDASTFEVAWSSDGTLFATANANGRIYFWDPQTSSELARLSGHQGAVQTIDFSPMEEHLLASGGEDGNIVIWQ